VKPHADRKPRGGPKCGAKGKRGRQKTCAHPAGFRTNHPGVGKCWLHGGATPIKHGLYSKVVSEQNQAMVEQLAKAPDLSSLDREIALMRVIIHEFSEKTFEAIEAIEGEKPEANAARFQAGVSRLQAIQEQIEQLSRVVHRKSAIDTAAAVKLTPTLTLQFIQIVEGLVARYVTKPEDYSSFVRELRAALPAVGAGGSAGAAGE
jgi:hypothetical protein